MKRSRIRVPYAQSVHGSAEIKAVVGVLKKNTALSECTKKFERNIADMFGKKYGIMVNSGSSANLLAFELLNLKKGSEVITPILTFATTVAPIIQKGLVPVFVDVEPETYLLNIQQVEQAITKKTRVLMIPSLIGNVPNLKLLKSIAKRHNLWLIEDSCDTLGATYGGKKTGTYSDISTTSFYGAHIINGAGGGGMILVDNPDWAEKLLVFRGWGRQSSIVGESKESENIQDRFKTRIGNIPYDSKFVFSAVGYNFLPMEISSAFALEQLKRFALFKRLRKRHFMELKNFFKQYERFFVLPLQTPKANTPWLAFPLTIKKNAPFSRRYICRYLEEHNIQTRPVFTGNILKQPAFKNIPSRKPFKRYPVADDIMRSGFLIGCHQGLADKHLRHLKGVFEEFLETFI